MLIALQSICRERRFKMAKITEKVTLEETATMLDLSIYRIRQMISSGEIDVIGKKDNKRLLVSKTQVEGIVAGRKMKENRAKLAQQKRKESVRIKTIAAMIKLLESEKPRDWQSAKKVLDGLVGKGKDNAKVDAISEKADTETVSSSGRAIG